MKKRIIALVAVLALVAILSVALVGCSASSYADKLEKAGYKTTIQDTEDSLIAANGLLDDSYDGKIVWSVKGVKVNVSITDIKLDTGVVNIYKFEKMSDAKKFYNEYLKDVDKDCKHVVGSVVITGDADGVKAAK